MINKMQSEKSKYPKIPKHNKLRLVYAVDKSGKPISYFHVENSEAKRIFAIIDLVKDTNDWVPINKIMEKDGRIDQKEIVSYPTLLSTLSKLAGVLWIDIRDGNDHVKLFEGETLHLKKEMYNTKRNLNPALNYLKPTIFVRRART